MSRQFDDGETHLDQPEPFRNNDLPSISAFPKDGKSWRIDWFGELAFPNRSIRRTQPSLLIHLSLVLDTRFSQDPTVLLASDSTSPAKFQRKVWISAGTLPLLRIGDIWRDGKLEASPDYQLETFADLRIEDSTISLVKAGLNLDEQGFLLPLAEHPWHMQCTHSYCVLADLPDKRRLIIPCVELIRFYFGSSSSLITKLFLPPLARRSLYSNAQFDKIKGHLTLELAEKISGASAADLGRLHLDPVAWRAALHVGTSALKASLASQHVFPQAFFPFEGATTLIAAGKWLSLGDAADVTFIVYNLRSCTHPFPFRSMRYRIPDGQGEPAASKSETNAGKNAQTRMAARDSTSQSIVEQDASNRLSSRTKTVRAEPRFPDLIKKHVWKNKTLRTTDAGVARGGTGAPVERASIGMTGSEQRIRPVDLAVALIPEKIFRQQVPEFLCDVVAELSKLRDFHVDVLTASDDDGWSIPIAAMADDEGEIDSRFFVDTGAGILRLRRSSVFVIRCGQRSLGLVVVESTPAYIRHHAMSSQSQIEIYEIMARVASEFPKRPDGDMASLVKLVEQFLGLNTCNANSYLI